MKQETNQHHSENNFEVDDWVFLGLQQYKEMSLMKQNKINKSTPKYYGPYKVLQRIGSMVYKLEIPPPSQVNPISHVSYLKKAIGDEIQFKLSW